MKRVENAPHEGRKLDKAVIDGEKVDDHHVFPRGYLEDFGQRGPVDSVLNHTLIDKKTNSRIGKKAPSTYVMEMEERLGVHLVRDILDSHGLPADPSGPLRTDDFEAFLQWRLEYLAGQLAEVSGGRVLRERAEGADFEATDGPAEETPFVEPDRVELGSDADWASGSH